MPSAIFVNSSARCSGVQSRHGPSNAAFAAATARSMSAGVATGTEPMTSSVVGDRTLRVSLPAGATHSPPMKNLSNVSIVPPSRARTAPGVRGIYRRQPPDTPLSSATTLWRSPTSAKFTPTMVGNRARCAMQLRTAGMSTS